jgi:hypothetical protein
MLQLINSTVAKFGLNLYSAAKRMVCSSCVQKYVAAFLMGFYCVSDAMASSKGAGGFSKATTEIQSYETPVSNLMKAIAAVIVLVGAFNVYFKMQNGDQDVKKTVMMTIGGCVAFIAMSEALPMFFK